MVTIQFLPYSEIEDLTSVGRIRRLLTLAKENKIVLLQGRLKKEEEAELIRTTMEEINREFKGIELSVIYPGDNISSGVFHKFKTGILNTLMGDRSGMTIVGPANVVKEIKKDPKKLNMLTIETGNIKAPTKKSGVVKKKISKKASYVAKSRIKTLKKKK